MDDYMRKDRLVKGNYYLIKETTAEPSYTTGYFDGSNHFSTAGGFYSLSVHNARAWANITIAKEELDNDP